MVGNLGSVNYLILEDYKPEDFNFTVSINTNYKDPKSKYMEYRSKITETPNGFRWNLSISKKHPTSF